jgi:hypothetical protein
MGVLSLVGFLGYALIVMWQLELSYDATLLEEVAEAVLFPPVRLPRLEHRRWDGKTLLVPG